MNKDEKDLLRKVLLILIINDLDMYCEEHQDKFWPHDDCLGPGIPIDLYRLLQILNRSVISEARL